MAAKLRQPDPDAMAAGMSARLLAEWAIYYKLYDRREREAIMQAEVTARAAHPVRTRKRA